MRRHTKPHTSHTMNANADGTTDDAPTPDDYTSADGADDRGIEMCPHCETPFSPNGGYFDVVYTQDGDPHESVYATEPGEGPFFCAPCFHTLDANRRAQENTTISEWRARARGVMDEDREVLDALDGDGQ